MAGHIFLHGGNVNRTSDSNDKFFEAIINCTGKDTIKVLCVYFARPEHRWEDSYEEDQYTFRRIALDMGKEIKTLLATYDLEDFEQKINQADIIFINGGMKGHLKDTLTTFGIERFNHLLNSKVLVGVSAGANVLSKYYYSMAAQGIREGTGLLNIKLLTHYSSDSPGQLELLQAHGENLQIVTIPEEQFVEI